MKTSAVLFRWHHWLGLFSGLLLLVVSLSGAALVFHAEIDDACWPQEAEIEGPVTAVAHDAALAAVQQRYPSHRLRLYLHPPEKALLFEARLGDHHRWVFVHPKSGRVLHDMDRFSAPSRWLLKFHYTLFAGLAGNFVLALLGFCMLGSLVTGLLVYRRRLLPVLLFREKVRWSSRKVFYSSSHRYVGVWALLLNLVLAITGLWLQIHIISVNSGTKPAASPQPTPIVSLQQAMDAVALHRQQFTPAFVILPADPASPILVYGKSQQTNPLLAKYADVLPISTATYTSEPLRLIAEQPLAQQLQAWVVALHFGNFGGLPVKLLYCLFGLAPAWLSVTGWLLYRKRSQAKQKRGPLPTKHANPVPAQ